MRKLCFILIGIMILLASCGGAASDDEIIGSLEALAPSAKELYSIIYSDVLPHGEIEKDGYAKISEESQYKSISELKEALSKVFTSDYCKIISNTAFVGVSSDEGAIHAKFIERENGLYVKPEVTEDFGAARDFDFSNAKVIKKNPYMAIVLITHVDGDTEVTMRSVNGVWLIDSPIF